MDKEEIQDHINTLQILLNTIDQEIDFVRPYTTTRAFQYTHSLQELKKTSRRIIDLQLDQLNGTNNEARIKRYRKKMAKQLSECEKNRQIVKLTK